MNVALLKQKIRSLLTYKTLDEATVKRIGEALEAAGDWDLHRMNPFDFAKRHSLDQAMTLDVFVHAAKIGLFDFEWNLLCPICGGVIYSQSTIGGINRTDYHCATCDLDTTTDLGDRVEVAFTIDPSVKKLRLDPFSAAENYQRYHYSAHHHMPAGVDKCREKGFLGFAAVSGGETGTLRAATVPGGLYRLVSADNNALLSIETTEAGAKDPLIVDVDVTPSGMTPDRLTIEHGDTTLKVHNHLNRTTGLTLCFVDLPGISKIFEKTPPWDDPFLTGKEILNNQSFRDLFRIQSLPNDLKLKVSNITILFTDLKGSTELYDKTGDMTAYNLVQEHFEILKAAVRRHSGAIIKTIGDAIMSSFSSPADAVTAAIDMIGDVRVLDDRSHGHAIAIKVGLHAGTALAVTANETLDYFGQTVNIAARVQGLADGGEMWVTDPVFKAKDFKTIVGDFGYSFERQSAILKGVSRPVTVYRCSGPRAAGQSSPRFSRSPSSSPR